MPDFSLTVLGANSAIPIPGRFSSAFILDHHSKKFLIDCGEGTQIKMAEFNIKRSKISHIFISHLHGDHIFGLPGFITSFILNGHKDNLTIIGPIGIADFLKNLPYVLGDHVTFNIQFIELQDSSVQELDLFDDLRITAFPLRHRVPTFGYRFDEIINRYNINPSAIEKYTLTLEEILDIKQGRTITRDHRKIPLTELTYPKKRPRSFAYCSDTAYDPNIIKHIQQVDVLYHEATYSQESQEKAEKYFHSTAAQAAQIAREAKVDKLLIGHYSSRYENPKILGDEARTIFDNTLCAHQGMMIPIG